MIQKSESIKNLAVALRKSQEEIKRVEFDATNPFLHNRYASLGAIIEASKSILVKNGLSVSQPVESNGNEIGITTLLLHDTGEYLSSTAMITISDEKGKSLAQVAGSIITYLRRYALASLLGMYADEDNDGGKEAEQKKKVIENQKQEGYAIAKEPPSGKMTLETASTVVSSDGQKYVNIDSQKLAFMANALQKAIKENKEPAQRETRMFKLDAIKTILQARDQSGAQ